MITIESTLLESLQSNSKATRRKTSVHNEILHHINCGNSALWLFMRGYLEAALWSSCDDIDEPLDRNYDISDIATDSLVSAWAECSRFLRESETNLTHLDNERNGHNFWLTRNHHGSGFWDEVVTDESAELSMQQLSHASHSFGEVDLYVGDDRKLHLSNEHLM